MDTITDRLDYTRKVLRDRGRAPFVWQLCESDFAELSPAPTLGGFYYESIPIVRSTGGMSICRTHDAHGTTIQAGTMAIADEVGGAVVERAPRERD